MVALASAAVENCVKEWEDGDRASYDFDEEHYRDVYVSHLASLEEWSSEFEERVNTFQADLLKRARQHGRLTVATKAVTKSGKSRISRSDMQEDYDDFQVQGQDIVAE